MTRMRAVLTGDLIGSESQGQAAVDRAMAVLARQAASLTRQTDADTKFTRYRGDGWQILLDAPGHSLNACLQMAAALRADGGPDSRISIGIGKVATLTADDLSAAQGEAFVQSGRALDAMKKGQRFDIAGPAYVTPCHDALLGLADWHSARWTREQAQAMALWLPDITQTHAEIAAQLRISRQAVQARLAGAGHLPWGDAILAFQATDWSDRDA